MRCPILSELPPPPSGKTGWPWTEQCNQLPDIISDTLAGLELAETSWPKVSIVTASYNQARFIEETIRSVLLQGYPDVEYFIIDGGSTDGSVEIIRKYEPWLAYWVSEKDRGQCHAINKGFAKCTGDIAAWLNSDDTYLPGALQKAVSALLKNRSIAFVYGSAQFIDEYGMFLSDYEGRPLQKGPKRMQYWRGWYVPQPTLFFDRMLLTRYGGLDERYHYGLDYEFVIRISEHCQGLWINDVIATYRMHGQSKTGDWERNKHLFFAENARINRKYAPLSSPRYWLLWLKWLVFRCGL